MHNKETAIAVKAPTLAFWGVRSIIMQSLLIVAAAALPAIAHLTGAPVRIILPMHWPVILAGLVFGWRGGALVGVLAPFASYLISGMPLPGIIPAMTVELGVYGLIAGLMREKFALNSFASVALAVIAGRLCFALTVLATVNAESSFGAYFQAALIPGIPAAIAQIIVLPILAGLWLKNAQGK